MGIFIFKSYTFSGPDIKEQKANKDI